MFVNKCPHNRVQQFTECCLDCGRNVYETAVEYDRYMRRQSQGNQEPRCPHNRVQQYTEYCLDCGKNIYDI